MSETANVPQDQKKEEFKKYLDKAGVLELLTASLVKLYEEPEKPNDALEYLKNNIGGSKADKEEISKLTCQNEELRKKVEELEKKETELKEKLEEASVPKAADEGTDKTQDMAMVEDVPAEPSTADMEETPPVAAAVEATPASEASPSSEDSPAADGVPEKNEAAMEDAMETEEAPVTVASEPTIETPAVSENNADTAEPNATTEEEKKAEIPNTEAVEAPKDADIQTAEQ